MLEELHRAVAPARLESARRTREPFPDIAVESLEQQHLAARRGDEDPRGHDAGVVDDDELTVQLVGQLCETPVADFTARAVVDEQPGIAALRRRVLSDERGGKLVVEVRNVHVLDGNRRDAGCSHLVSDTRTWCSRPWHVPFAGRSTTCV